MREEKTILLIDDDIDWLAYMEAVLEHEGFRVVTANDGWGGLALALSRKPNLIFLDVMMPDLDGWDTCDELRSHMADKNVPVVFLTCVDPPGSLYQRHGAFETDWDEYLNKPVGPEELLAVVRKLLANRSPAAAGTPARPYAVVDAPPRFQAGPGHWLSESTLADVRRCYQCKKCSSGCPVGFAMDTLPHQIMRLAQLGSEDHVFSANTHWVCSSCQTCSTRCPNDIDIAGVMDELRQLAAQRRAVSEKNAELFHRIFLAQVRRHGRVHELSMIGEFKLMSGRLVEDLPMGIGMLAKGKLGLFPQRIKRPREIRGLFEKGAGK